MDGSYLLVSFFFSLVGFAVFTFGRKQRRAAPLLIGSVLMGYPYFVSDARAIAAIGVGLLLALYFGLRLE